MTESHHANFRQRKQQSNPMEIGQEKAQKTTPAHESTASPGEMSLGQILERHDEQIQRLLDDTPQSIGRYQIIKELGRGGMGKVYQAYDPELKRTVALKTMLSSGNPELLKRFVKEAEAMAKLSHPQIVKIYDIGRQGETCYFTMDLIEGKNLAAWIAEEKMTVRRAVEIVWKMAGAIEYAHRQGILHRDLKPSNVMIDGESEPRIMDFGLAQEMEAGIQHSRSGSPIGTPAYMPPEQVLGKRKEIDERSDVYSLGAVLYEALTGAPPFRGPNAHIIFEQVVHKDPLAPSRLSKKIPRDVEQICLKAMEKKKIQRYQSAQELAKDLERFLGGEPVLAMAHGPTYHLLKWMARNRLLATVIGVCGAVLLAMGLFWQWQILAQRDRARQAEQTAKMAWQTALGERDGARRAEDQARQQRTNAVEALVRSYLVQAEAYWSEGETQRSCLLYARAIWEGTDGEASAELVNRGRRWLSYRFPEAFRCRRVLVQEQQGGVKSLVAAMALHPQDKIIATGSKDGLIRLWDRQSGICQSILRGHTANVDALGFSPDGRRLASGGIDGEIRLWDHRQGHSQLLASGLLAVYSVAFSPDGKWLAAGSADKMARVWEVASGRLAMTLEGHEQAVMSVAFHPQVPILASGSRDETVRLWDLAKGAPKAILSGHTEMIRSVAFSPDGRLLASAGEDGTVRLWDAQTQNLQGMLLGYGHWIYSLAFSPNGQQLACGHWDSTVRVWEMATRRLVAILRGHRDAIAGVAFSPDGQTLVSGSMDCTIRLWESEVQRTRAMLRGPRAGVRTLAFAPRGQTLASGGLDGTIALWELATGKTRLVFQGHQAPVWCVAFRADGQLLASAGYDRVIRVWEVASGRLLATGKGHTGAVNAVAFSPDGKTLASASFDHSVRLWDADTGRLRQVLNGHSTWVWSLAFSPDGKTLVSVDNDGEPRLWDAETGVLRHAHSDESRMDAFTVAFSPDGQAIAIGRYDGDVWFWDRQLQDHRICKGHGAPVNIVCFTPDSQTLASVSIDGTARLWDVASASMQSILRGHSSAVFAATISHDGALLASGGQDGTIRLWSLACDRHWLTLPANEVVQRVEQAVGYRLEVSPGEGFLFTPIVAK